MNHIHIWRESDGKALTFQLFSHRLILLLCSSAATSRPPREGEEQMNTYNFVSREEFEEGIRTNKFLEFAEKDGNLYGINSDHVRDVIRSVPTTLSVSQRVIKLLQTFFFIPYVGK